MFAYLFTCFADSNRITTGYLWNSNTSAYLIRTTQYDVAKVRNSPTKVGKQLTHRTIQQEAHIRVLWRQQYLYPTGVERSYAVAGRPISGNYPQRTSK